MLALAPFVWDAIPGNILPPSRLATIPGQRQGKFVPAASEISCLSLIRKSRESNVIMYSETQI
jgi:hypothetical protein